jgi:hypothetical protein
MARFTPEEVFTPTAPAIDSMVYARREAAETTFKQILQERGNQVLVYGDSAIGKTSFVLTELLRTKLSYVRVQCTSRITWDQISPEILRKLEDGIVLRQLSTTGLSPEVSVNVYFAQAKLGGNLETQTEKLMAGNMGTVLHIADVLGKHGISLVIDDFEKANKGSTQSCVANLAKNLSDSASSSKSARVIVIGISDNADDLIDGDLSIASRLQALHLPRMTEDEMIQILHIGFTKLGITCPLGIMTKLASLLGGFPKYAHAMGLELSRVVLDSKERTISWDHFENAIHKFLHRYCRTAKTRYNKATVVRCTPKPEYILVVKGLAEIGLKGEFTFEQAIEALENYDQSLPSTGDRRGEFDKQKFRRTLDELCKSIRGPMFSRSRTTGLYRFSDPLSPIYISLDGYFEY